MASDLFGLVGATIDNRYRVDAVIGEGGFGVVYRGFHLAFKHAVAVKCLKLPGHFTPEAQALFLEKFREEGAFLSRLSEHPSIVRVFDLNVTRTARGQDVPYLVLEWLEGQELQEILAARSRAGEPPHGEEQALLLMRPVVEAIALAHAHKIAHRDLKPANLFAVETTTGPALKVLDFGIAKAMQDGDTATQIATHTSSGFNAFSPHYGAPEQFRTKRFGATGPWTDVHALGLILTELVVGAPALVGEEIADFYEVGTREQRPTPRARGRHVSDGFEALIQRAIALEPRNRFPTAHELGVAMDNLLGRAPAPMPSMRIERPAGSTVVGPTAAPGPTVAPTALPAATSAPAAASSGATEIAGQSRTVLAGAPLPLPLAPAPALRPRPPKTNLVPVALGLLALGAVGAGVFVVASKPAATSTAVGGPSAASATEPRRADSPDRAVGASAASEDVATVQPASCPEGMSLIDGATFKMGSDKGRKDEQPIHDEKVATFCIDRTEVTVAAYSACVEARACGRAPTTTTNSAVSSFADQFCNGDSTRKDHPINCVDASHATAYCSWAKKRLPTEAEWELAARSGTGRTYPWGEDAPRLGLLNACGAECKALQQVSASTLYPDDDGFPSTAPVGSFPSGATKEGVLDLAGNVWEWTATRYCPYDRPGCTTEEVVNRGGGWGSDGALFVRGALRSRNLGTFRSAFIGFRCAKGAE